MISGLAKANETLEAERLLRCMEAGGVRPSVAVFNALLDARAVGGGDALGLLRRMQRRQAPGAQRGGGTWGSSAWRGSWPAWRRKPRLRWPPGARCWSRPQSEGEKSASMFARRRRALARDDCRDAHLEGCVAPDEGRQDARGSRPKAFRSCCEAGGLRDIVGAFGLPHVQDRALVCVKNKASYTPEL